MICYDHERFWAKVNKTETCWLWTAAVCRGPYGVFATWRDGKRFLAKAHRLAYEELVGPIPEGLTLDHVKARGCTSKLCVNPAHLEPCTNKENILRGDAPSARAARRETCANGHPWTEESTYRSPFRGHRECRICKAERYAAEGHATKIKLSDTDLADIKALASMGVLSRKALAERFNVHPMTISRVIHDRERKPARQVCFSARMPA